MRLKTLRLIFGLLLCTVNVVKGQGCSKEQFISTKHLDLSKLEDTPNGNTVRLSCAVGYVPMLRFKCEQGLWITQSDLPCEPVKCPVIQANNNVVVIGDSKDATYGNVI
ncbi:hypothetical protein UPYG_G00032810 [Umbra pygmaea]|uniref:Sushi domain-containing protein n=1 Tax=Umbra pygmaea TaxID=75934 RepID=A0ABD0Y6Y7_UMBPY